MKKLIAIIVTVCMCVCFCAPLAACDFETGSNTGPHMCYFTQAVADSRYLASEATCTTGALYYYSCSCGGKGTTTFEYGYPLNHSFTNYVSNNDATHDTDGTKTATCDRAGCNATDTITDHGTKGHSYSEEWYYDENNHWHICPICYDKTNIVAHTYSNGVCSICGSTDLSITSTINVWYVGGNKSVHISERVVQRCLCDYVLVPLLSRSFIYDNGACLKNKGIDFALNRMNCHLQRYYRQYGNSGYALVFDFSKYFDNINHQKLIELLKTKVKDKEMYNLLVMLINDFGGEKGLGLGSQISQICALTYPMVT